ncbi:hypothetical protein [Persicobacter psychrovividus]|uniref:Uncharacterized protein n=1 Tax=Persicobacter psychrovividus TaxID=387638 RepID=A0ABM7VKP6_9BACT|nr:hypothetical protein PEPS_38440 [Persicobacter psychrovividus]
MDLSRLKELQEVSAKLKIAHELLVDQLERSGISEEIMDQLVDLHRRYYSLQKDLTRLKAKIEIEEFNEDIKREMSLLDRQNAWLKNHFR